MTPPPHFIFFLHVSAGAGAIQFYSEGARNANMTLMYELLGEKAKVGRARRVVLYKLVLWDSPRRGRSCFFVANSGKSLGSVNSVYVCV